MKKKLVMLLCVFSLAGCGKQPPVVPETVTVNVDNSYVTNNNYMSDLHSCLDDICGSSSDENVFVALSAGDTVEYTLNGNVISYDTYRLLNKKLSLLSAEELNEFELLSYAVYLAGGRDATASGLSSSYPALIGGDCQTKLFDYMVDVYNENLEEKSFSEALSESRSLYYDTVVGIPYDQAGDFLQIGDNVLMSGLFGFGNDETVVESFATRPTQVSYIVRDAEGNETRIDGTLTVSISIGSAGTVIGYETVESESFAGKVLRDVYYLRGGGCVNGTLEGGVLGEDGYLVFGKRDFRNLSIAESERLFKSYVLGCMSTYTSASYSIQKECGITLQGSEGVGVGSRLLKAGYYPDEATVRDLSVSSVHSDLYGWYGLQMPGGVRKGDCRVEGFGVIHVRDYGFSGENYVRLF